MLRLLIALTLMAPAGALTAHPHIFVDVALRVLVSEDGQAEAIEVTWSYDEFYSLLILEDRGLDPDYDGILTPEALAALQNWDLQWVEGFEGDTFAMRNGVPVTLGAPEGLGADIVNNKIVTRHRRSLTGPAEGLELRAFDPTYYTAYELNGNVTASGSCTANVQPADKLAALDQVAAVIRTMNDADVEIRFPEVGELFADRVTLSCAK